MQQLEALCIQLGIPEHIPALSELRDDLFRETAAQLQIAAQEIATKTAELETVQQALAAAELEIATKTAELERVQQALVTFHQDGPGTLK